MRLLLIEDDRDLGYGLRRALERNDYAVDWVADGIMADAILKTEPFDLIVLDLSLPGLDGLEVLKRLRERGSQTPVLVLTARGEIDERIAGLDLGADDYLVKPLKKRGQVLHGHTHLQSMILKCDLARPDHCFSRGRLVDGEEGVRARESSSGFWRWLDEKPRRWSGGVAVHECPLSSPPCYPEADEEGRWRNREHVVD